jgi:hypothetical protein
MAEIHFSEEDANALKGRVVVLTGASYHPSSLKPSNADLKLPIQAERKASVRRP